MTTLLAARDISKSYGGRRGLSFSRTRTDAVSHVSFDVPEGRTLGLIGESGAGKSTSARIAARLIEPDSGSVLFDGVDLLSLSRTEMRRTRAQLQMVFQNPYGSFDPRVTIGDSVAEPLVVHQSASRRERQMLVADMLKRVGLPDAYMNRYPRELSGGQLQRAAIARALTTTPKLIICDEPVAALDVLVRAQVLNLMKELQQAFGLAYLFITHDLSILRAMANNVAVMRHGEIVESGSVEQLLNEPSHAYTRQLIATAPSLVPKALRASTSNRT